MLTVDEHNVPGPHCVEPLADRRVGHRRAHHDIGTELLTDRVLEQVFGRGDDDVVVQPLPLIGPDDGPGQCPGEFSDMFGKAVPRRCRRRRRDRRGSRLARTRRVHQAIGGGALANDNRSSGVGYCEPHAIDRFEACEAAS